MIIVFQKMFVIINFITTCCQLVVTIVFIINYHYSILFLSFFIIIFLLCYCSYSYYCHVISYIVSIIMIFMMITKGSLGYLSSMYFSTSSVLGEVVGPFLEIDGWK